MVRLICIVLVVGSACQRPAVSFDAGLDGGLTDSGTRGCAGCIGLDGGCEPGFARLNCGRGGDVCAECTNGECINGRCEVPGGGCFAPPVPGAEWTTGSCPDAGCPSGSICLAGRGESASVFGCVPVPQSCLNGVPSCGCMGCLCGIDCYPAIGGLECDNGTVSTREQKREIRYLDEAAQGRLALEATQIRLATYRYRTDPPSGKVRLGFIIEDQPSGSVIVRQDRQHVDEYSYASMLLATIQMQAKQIGALEARVKRLESSNRAKGNR